MSSALIVPLRDFGTAKTRLSEFLSVEQRRRLAELCAHRVLDRGVRCPRIVVCDCDSVELWAHGSGAECVRVTEVGLNAALTAALPEIRQRHPNSDLVIAHGDIVDPLALDEILTSDDFAPIDVVIVPDRHRTGTNVLRLSTRVASDWVFAYGPGSFDRHRLQAAANGWSLHVLIDEGLATDLDTPDDLREERVRSLLTAHFPDWSLPELESP
jgi:2-phospho-L-lactate guanylyltransferase